MSGYNNCVVYRHIRLDKKEPFYIGIGVNKRRAYEKTRRSVFWKNIVEKSDYEVEILFENVSVEFAKQKEIEFIKLYGRRNLNTGTLVNLTNGGDGVLGIKFSKESRKKISEASKKAMQNQHTRDNISKKLKKFYKNPIQKERLLTNGSKEVLHIKTGKTYKSLTDACKKLNLIYKTQAGYIHRNSSKKQFIYIQSNKD